MYSGPDMLTGVSLLGKMHSVLFFLFNRDFYRWWCEREVGEKYRQQQNADFQPHTDTRIHGSFIIKIYIHHHC